MGYPIFLAPFESNIFSCFCFKINWQHLSCYTVLFFLLLFSYLTYVYQSEISRSSHREVFLIMTGPVGGGTENTYDIIL